jgi:SAM-dependent methyltransferase
MVNWLNAVAPSLVRCGARVAVVGCGLGDDAREVISRGYDVTAFDCSPTAVEWAQGLDPSHTESYTQADLFKPPGRWVRRFDLVVEINNLQYLTLPLQKDAVAALSRFVAPHGHLLVVCRGADEPAESDAGPPWPLTEQQLVAAAAAAGLTPDEEVCCFSDDENIKRIRALFRRA